MAFKFIDNFQFWTTVANGTLTTSYASVGAITVSSGRLSSVGAVKGGALVSNNITSQPTYTINLRMNAQSLSFGNGGDLSDGPPSGFCPFVNLNDGGQFAGNCQAGLGIRTDGKLQFYRGDKTAIGGVSSTAIHTDVGITFYDIEYQITINDTTGAIEARINGGVEIGPTSGLDTKARSNASANSLTIWGYNAVDNTLTPNMLIEHLLIMDSTGSAGNTFLGPVDVDLLQPTGDGFYTDWSFTGAATRWQCVDDADPNEDTDYIFTATVGNKNTFTHPNLPAGTTLVKGLCAWSRGRRDDAATRAFKTLLRSSGTDNLGSVEFFMGDNYQWFFQPYEVSPFTSSAWTVSEVNGLEFGVQVTQ